MTEPPTTVSVTEAVAVYALAALYLLLTVGYVWVRVHCPVAHRRGDKRAYLRHCWRVWCAYWRGERDHFRSDIACVCRALRRVGLAVPSSHGEGCSQASAPDTAPTLTPDGVTVTGQSALSARPGRGRHATPPEPVEHPALQPATVPVISRSSLGRGGPESTAGARMTAKGCASAAPRIGE